MNQPFVPNVIGKKNKTRRRLPRNKVETRRIHLLKYPYGVVAKHYGLLFSNHIEMMRKTIANYFSRKEQQWIRIYPNRSYTEKPCDVRRGRGKGSIEGWYYFARTNRVLVEFTAPNVTAALDLIRIINSKLPIKIILKQQPILTNNNEAT